MALEFNHFGLPSAYFFIFLLMILLKLKRDTEKNNNKQINKRLIGSTEG